MSVKTRTGILYAVKFLKKVLKNEKKPKNLKKPYSEKNRNSKENFTTKTKKKSNKKKTKKEKQRQKKRKNKQGMIENNIKKLEYYGRNRRKNKKILKISFGR